MGQRDVATRGLHTLQQRALKRQKKKKERRAVGALDTRASRVLESM